MSMPLITTGSNPISMEQAIANLLASVALEEAALSHIMNAEGEQLQAILQMDCTCAKTLTDANDSVRELLCCVQELEATLRDKLEFISNNLYYPPSEE